MLVAVGSHIASQFAAQRIRHDRYRWSCYATVKNPIVSSSSASPPLLPQARTHEYTSTTISMQRAWETHVKRHRICAWCSRERNETVSMSLPWERSEEKNGVSEGLTGSMASFCALMYAVLLHAASLSLLVAARASETIQIAVSNKSS
jgi:hypothetical protein